MEKLAIISADGHAGMPVEGYREYLEARYHDDLDVLVAEEQEYTDATSRISRFSAAQLEVIDGEGVIADDGHVGAWDLGRRIAEMDREGVTAETFLNGHQFAASLFFGSANRPRSAELRMAGVRAFNRWQADMMSAAPGRIIGVTEQSTVADLAETVEEIRWAGEHGFRALTFPSVTDPSIEQPPLHDSYWEPVWKAAADYSMALVLHVALGGPQGAALDLFVARAKAATVGGEYNRNAPRDAGNMMEAGNLMEDERIKDFFALNDSPRMVLWQLMVGGVFDRYPNLHFVPTEARADWVPATLALMDARFERGDTGLKRRPSEYWATNGFAGASFIHRHELVDRHDIGVQNLMFGRDYPHPEGTWPNTKDWLRAAFAGVPENEARMILGENAIRCYGLDPATVRGIADRVGPKAEEILGDHHVDPRMIDEFDKRGGFAKPAPEVAAERLNEIMDAALV